MEVVKIHFCFFFFSARDLHPSFAVIASLFSTSFFFLTDFCKEGYHIWFANFMEIIFKMIFYQTLGSEFIKYVIMCLF